MSGNFLPPNPFAETLGRCVLKLMGWRVEGQLPALDKFVMIGAHHTSNWDFVVFIAAKFVLRVNARWFGKHSIFRWPFRGILRRWGAFPSAATRRPTWLSRPCRAFASTPSSS